MKRAVTVTLAILLSACGARTGVRDDSGDGGPHPDADAPIPQEPTVTCSPEESWTTIGRSAVAYAEAHDDGWVVSYEWSLVDGPAGTTAAPSPSRASATSLVPDSAGDFVLEATVTDDDGLQASCRTTVHSIVGPPVAFCPDNVTGASVGRPYTLEGDGFDDVYVASFLWQVTSAPSGSTAQPVPPDQPTTTFTPDLAGSYRLLLTVTDNEGLQGSCTVVVTSSGPPSAICPAPTTAPTRQPVALHGDAEDDGTIAIWLWEMIERPARSAAEPTPAAAQDTTLVPDRVGVYRVRLTVTDDTGLSDSCETTVTATPTPPDALCPGPVSTTPLTEVTLTGDGIDDGMIVAYSWSLVSSPEGSAALPPSPASDRVTTFMPDIAGEYRLGLTVTDDDGMQGSCETVVTAIPGEGLRIELYWNPPDHSCDTHPGTGCDPTDVDLHLLHPDAPHWFDYSGASLDCFYATCIGGTEWDVAGPEDDPRLDLDDVEGHGPENINIDVPVTGHTYSVGVHYYTDDGTGIVPQTYIRIYCSTISADPVYEVGPVEIRAHGMPDDNDFWRVADVAWNGVTCSVTPRYGPSGEPDIIIASEAQGTR